MICRINPDRHRRRLDIFYLGGTERPLYSRFPRTAAFRLGSLLFRLCRHGALRLHLTLLRLLLILAAAFIPAFSLAFAIFLRFAAGILTLNRLAGFIVFVVLR